MLVNSVRCRAMRTLPAKSFRRFSSQHRNGQQASTANGSKSTAPARPAAPRAPRFCGMGRTPAPNSHYAESSLNGGLARTLAQASRLRRCRHNVVLGAPPASVRVRAAAGWSGATRVSVHKIAVFSFRLRQQLPSPRARVPFRSVR